MEDAVLVRFSFPTALTAWRESSDYYMLACRFHLGRGRQAPEDQPVRIHETVRERMQDPTLKYTPRATWKAGTEIYVS